MNAKSNTIVDSHRIISTYCGALSNPIYEMDDDEEICPTTSSRVENVYEDLSEDKRRFSVPRPYEVPVAGKRGEVSVHPKNVAVEAEYAVVVKTSCTDNAEAAGPGNEQAMYNSTSHSQVANTEV